MAYLNVRERRLETKIAYLGFDDHLAEATLKHLQGAAKGRAGEILTEEDGLSLEWRPLSLGTFEDCEIAVKLVASAAATSDEVHAVLSDADGVVVMMNAAGELDARRRTVDVVRGALERNGIAVPVVVQLNDAASGPGSDVAEIAAGVTWPVVRADAENGEGVVETIEAALAAVIDQMKARTARDTPHPPRPEKNPLLSALRDILRETVSDHMARVESAVSARIAAAVAERMSPIERGLRDVREAVVALADKPAATEHIAPLEGSLRTLQEAVEKLAESTAAAHAAREVEHVSLLDRVAELEETLERLSTRTRGDIDAAGARLREQVAGDARSDREHAAAMGAALRRGLDAIVVELKRQDTADNREELASKLSALATRVEQIGTAAEAARAPIERVIASEVVSARTALQKEIATASGATRARVTELEEAVKELRSVTTEVLGRTERRTGEIHGGLNELLEELKKRKKGWFS